MTDSVEDMVIIDLSDLKIALECATSVLDTELCAALNELIVKLHLSLTTEETFKGEEVDQLASIKSYKYEISRKWFKGKSFKHQLIAILIDAAKNDMHKAFWVAITDVC
ncbi:hypothetical protein [Psychrobacter sanguinis]|uniref:hypothetical protein n=1 Tax=Psychrobacter sanguinis TaxID=861445 RepID=UPI001918BFAE|nr:hypothetical protein [Psychrobacter sanguinis]UEC25546.1 hypothetical protein LK453_13725 [Psychrobacter sanguinis]